MVIPLKVEQMKIFVVLYCVDGEQLDPERGEEWKQLCRQGPGGPGHESAPCPWHAHGLWDPGMCWESAARRSREVIFPSAEPGVLCPGNV